LRFCYYILDLAYAHVHSFFSEFRNTPSRGRRLLLQCANCAVTPTKRKMSRMSLPPKCKTLLQD
jgi:hypothetical protein